MVQAEHTSKEEQNKISNYHPICCTDKITAGTNSDSPFKNYFIQDDKYAKYRVSGLLKLLKYIKISVIILSCPACMASL